MKVTNISSSSIYLSFVPININAGETVTIADSFLSHPQMVSLLGAANPSIQVSGVGTVSNNTNTVTQAQKAGLDASISPGSSNRYMTESDIESKFVVHSQDTTAHHTNKNDPSTNQKEAMNKASNPSGINPFTTDTVADGKITTALNTHVATYDHTPTPFTVDEIAALKNSTAPSAGNPVQTVSWIQSEIASSVGTHASNAIAHHSNANDPSSDEKAAMTAASSPTGANPFLTDNDLTTHEGLATVHHSNANDPTTAQKQGLDASSPGITVLNPVVTEGHARMPSTDVIGALNAASPAGTAANPFVTNNDTRLDTSTHPTSDEKAALAGTNGAPGDLNRYVTDSDGRILTTDEKGSMTSATPAPTAANPVVTSSDTRIPTQDENDALVGSDGSPSAINPYVTDSDSRLDTSNDPTSDEKAALAGTNGSPSVSNKYVTDSDPRLLTTDEKAAATNADTPSAANPFLVDSDLTTHTSDADAHHDNSNDPTADQKAALAGTSGSPSGANAYVTDADSRMTNDRDPNNHASNHTDGTDDIQDASSSQKGLMTLAYASAVDKYIKSLADVRLVWTSSSTVTLNGIGATKAISVNGEIVDLSSGFSCAYLTDNTIDSDGADTSTTPVNNSNLRLYVSNSQASYAPSSLRVGTGAPVWDSTTGKYLANTTGNGRNWAFVGWARSGVNIFNQDVASYFNPEEWLWDLAGSGTDSASVDATYEIISGMTMGVILPDGWVFDFHCMAPMSHTSTGIETRLAVGYSTNNYLVNRADTEVASSYTPLSGFYRHANTSAGIEFNTWEMRHYYSTASGSSTNAGQSRMVLIRKPGVGTTV